VDLLANTFATASEVIFDLFRRRVFVIEQRDIHGDRRADAAREKPTYIDLPPFEWQVFYANMDALYETLDGVKTAIEEWLDHPRRRTSTRKCSRNGPRTWPRRC